MAPPQVSPGPSAKADQISGKTERKGDMLNNVLFFKTHLTC